MQKSLNVWILLRDLIYYLAKLFYKTNSFGYILYIYIIYISIYYIILLYNTHNCDHRSVQIYVNVSMQTM